jgi:hypothetical protein
MRVYIQDTWKFRSNLTLSYGLAWEHETNLFNEDLPRPAFLNPVDGGYSTPATPSKHDFSPSVGFAWSPKNNNKWVIRGGGGLFWDTEYLYRRLQERSEIGPLGNGRVQYPTTGFTLPVNSAALTLPPIINVVNTLGYLGATGKFVPQLVAPGSPLPETITTLTLGEFEQIYNLEEPGIAKTLATPVNGVTAIDVAKSGAELLPGNYPIPRVYHMSLGFQHQLRHDTIITADFVRRVAINQLWGNTDIDLNHYAHYVASGTGSVNAPVIPLCTSANSTTPGVECSTGPITFWQPGARNTYQALLVKADKRFANRFQFTASYALQSQYGVNGIYNSYNYAESWGPQGSRSILNIVGVYDLGWGFQLGLVSSLHTRGPLTPTVGGFPSSNSGAGGGTPLPGLGFNCLNAGCGKSQLASAVATYNSTVAGTEEPNLQGKYPTISLPANYELGEGGQSQDLRLTKTFTYKERYKASAFVEMFNVFNVSNLSGYSFNLAQTSTFGQPTQRTGQVFGSGGPRAVQIGARVSF